MIVCDLLDWQQYRKIEVHMEDCRENRTRTSVEFWDFFWLFVLVNRTRIVNSNPANVACVGDKWVAIFYEFEQLFPSIKHSGHFRTWASLLTRYRYLQASLLKIIIKDMFSDAESDDTDAYMSDTGSQISTYSCASRFSMTSTGSRRISR